MNWLRGGTCWTCWKWLKEQRGPPPPLFGPLFGFRTTTYIEHNDTIVRLESKQFVYSTARHFLQSEWVEELVAMRSEKKNKIAMLALPFYVYVCSVCLVFCQNGG